MPLSPQVRLKSPQSRSFNEGAYQTIPKKQWGGRNNKQLSPMAERAIRNFDPQDPFALDENVKLVPCRWSNTGWKYAMKDPAE